MFDKAMQIWTSQAVAAGIPLSDMMLQEKGLEFAKSLKIENEIKCANGWVYKFKQRNRLHKVNFSGEANSTPLATLSEERSRLKRILSNYSREDIYNVNETGLFFRMEPNQTLATGKVSGRKKDKNRLSVLLWFHIMDRKILLLVNNAGSHFNPKILDENDNNTDEEVDDSDSDSEETIAESSHSAQHWSE
ncbi:unnamed protein product [Rhizophagus irregularis]|nr:unnamed protein product [Rhizophagus irregularis]